MTRQYDTIKRFRLTEEVAHVITINCKRLTQKEVADILGCSVVTVQKYAAIIGAKFKKSGENKHSTKLSNHDVELIRQLSDSGMKQREIASKFDVSQACISSIVNYKERCYDF